MYIHNNIVRHESSDLFCYLNRKQYHIQGKVKYDTPESEVYKIIIDTIGENEIQYKYYRNNHLSNLPSFPLVIFLELTDKCNLNCRHCYNSSNKNNSNFISISQVQSLIEECKNNGVFFISLTGGEPLLHPDIDEILNMFVKHGINIFLNTNGVLDDYKVFQILTKYKIPVTISIDGNEKNHDFLRGKGNYKKSMNLVYELYNQGIEVSLSYTINSINFEDLFNLSREIDNSIKVFVKRVKPTGRANTSLTIPKDIKYYSNIEKLNSLPKNIIVVDGMLKTKNDIFSFFPFPKLDAAAIRSCSIDSIGDVWACSFLRPDWNFGNAFNVSLKKIWNESNIINDFRKMNIESSKVCDGCYKQNTCNNECFVFRPDVLKKDPYCIKDLK